MGSIVIEVLRKTCCIGIVPNYHGRSKYNLVELAMKLNLADNTNSTGKKDSSESVAGRCTHTHFKYTVSIRNESSFRHYV